MGETELGDLPQECIARILRALSSPKEVGRLGLVNREFWEASCSDLAWERRLPPHQSCHDLFSSFGAKQLYLKLSAGIFCNDKQLFYSIDLETGGVTNMISARSLQIVWGDDRRYWKWCRYSGSRFDEVAHLVMVCWFEVSGKFQATLRPGSYTMSFRLSMSRSSTNSFRDPVKMTIRTDDGQHQESLRAMSTDESGLGDAGGGWTDFEIGEFLVESDSNPTVVEFSMIQTESNWKSGLYVDGVVVRPSILLAHRRSVN